MKKKYKIVLVILLIAIVAIVTGVLINKKRIEDRKYEIETISEYKYFVIREDGKCGVINTSGNKIVDTDFDIIRIPNPEKGVFICYKDDTTKVLNEKGEEIFSEYHDVEPLRLKNVTGDLVYEKSILRYEENGKYGIINFEGQKKTDAIYEQIDTLAFKEGELLVKKDGKYGVINLKGTTLVDAKYDKIDTDKFYDEEQGYKNAGYIVSNTTEEGYRYGYITVDGNELSDTKYNELYRINEIKGDDIYLVCAENGKYGVVKNGDKVIENTYQSITYSPSSNTIVALKGKKYGVISMTGDVIVPFEYSKPIDITGEYIYAENEDGDVTVYDTKGNKTDIAKNQAMINIQDTDYKIYIETKDGRTTYSLYVNDKKKNTNEYTYIQYLHDNYFIAADLNGRLGIINDEAKTILQFVYTSIQIIDNTKMLQAVIDDTTEIYSSDMNKISELTNARIEVKKDYIRFYNDDEIKYISLDEKEVKNTEILKGNKIFAKKSGSKWGFVDANGDTVVEFIYDKVTEINEYGFAGIKQNNKWGIINNDGKIIVEPEYELNDNIPMFIGMYYRVIYGNGEIYYTK